MFAVLRRTLELASQHTELLKPNLSNALLHILSIEISQVWFPAMKTWDSQLLVQHYGLTWPLPMEANVHWPAFPTHPVSRRYV